MEAKEYFKIKKRMCEKYVIEDCCESCPLGYSMNGLWINCGEFETEYPSEAEEIVQKWAREHLLKTRQNVLLSVFPNIIPNAEGYIDLCPRYTVDTEFVCPKKDNVYADCATCKKGYWLGIYEEPKDGDK